MYATYQKVLVVFVKKHVPWICLFFVNKNILNFVLEMALCASIQGKQLLKMPYLWVLRRCVATICMRRAKTSAFSQLAHSCLNAFRPELDLILLPVSLLSNSLHMAFYLALPLCVNLQLVEFMCIWCCDTLQGALAECNMAGSFSRKQVN